MKIVITGCDGQVGRALTRCLAANPKLFLMPLNRQQLELTDATYLSRTLDQLAPNLIINAAAYNAVDEAERTPDLAYAVNCHAVANLANYCDRTRCTLLHLSTDYIFDGQQNHPYQEDASPAPLNHYGRSKLAGEQQLTETLDHPIIIRVSAVFSPWRHNFVKTILQNAQSCEELTVVNNQITCPTPATAIAKMVNQLVNALNKGAKLFGCYHYCGHEAISWYDFACTIIELAQTHSPGRWATVTPISAEQTLQLAKRPRYSVLSCDKIHNELALSPVDWYQDLATMIPIILNSNHF